MKMTHFARRHKCISTMHANLHHEHAFRIQSDAHTHKESVNHLLYATISRTYFTIAHGNSRDRRFTKGNKAKLHTLVKVVSQLTA